ncbi:MAG: amidase family protein [Pseudomonadota bacterium]
MGNVVPQKSAAQLGREIAEGKTDPVELTEATLERMDNHEARDDIFTMVTHDRARAEAEAARIRQQDGALASPLDGVPISWKDLFDTKGLVTEAGSKLIAGRVPDDDCEVLKRSSKAGLICAAKTHMSELAFSGLGINPSTGTPPNIHGKELAPGGSSSGAGSCVAHGLTPIGVGSDTGGSVRIPSVWNDLVGLKTTAELIPNTGVVPLCSGFDTVGPLCTTVEDAWLSTCIFADRKPEMPEAKPLSECSFLVNETIMLDDLGTNQREGFELAVEALQSAGAKVTRAPIPECETIIPLGPIMFPYEAWAEWGELISANPELMFEGVRNRFMSGKDFTEAQYKEAWDEMLKLRETYAARVAEYDAVLAPTIAIAPPNVSELLADMKLFQETNMMALRNTRFFNMFGVCALTLPTSKPAAGLMIAGKAFGEEDLVSVGLSIEAIL